MDRAAMKTRLAILLGLLVLAAQVRAQTEAGTVAAVVGTLQIGRAGTWQNAAVGVPVFIGDQLRTGAKDQAKIVFRDDSVLDLAPNTEISLDKQVFDPDAHKYQSQLRLLTGKIRAWVSDYYHEPHARYEVETPTALAGVRGTEFVAVYDSAGGYTDVVGVEDTVDLTGKLGVIGAAVQVGPQFFSRVKKGRFPTPPERLDDVLFRQYLEGLEIIGTGRRDGLNVQHPASEGRVLAAQDVPAPVTTSAVAETLAIGAPLEFLGDRLSPDVYTNSQPLKDFEKTPPGVPPPPNTGGVKVGF